MSWRIDGRQGRGDSPQISLRITEQDYSKLKKLARKRDVSLSRLVRDMIDSGLAKERKKLRRR